MCVCGVCVCVYVCVCMCVCVCVWYVWMYVFGMYVSMYLAAPGLTCGMQDLLVVA